MIVIENKNTTAETIGNTLLESNIEAIGWDSALVPLYKMLEDKNPNLLIYGKEANMNGVDHIKQRFPQLTLAYLGDDPVGEVVADLIIGKSYSNKFMALPTSIYDITKLPSGTRRGSMLCEMACFTDSMDQNTAGPISDIIMNLLERKVRFFGNVKLDSHQYLGVVNEQERADIISSAGIYIDLSADYWHKSVMLGTVPIVLSDAKIPGINTFTNTETLSQAIEDVSLNNYDLSLAKKEILKNTGFDFCADIFSALGAEEAKASVLQSKEKFV